jgi:hypothetical protein
VVKPSLKWAKMPRFVFLSICSLICLARSEEWPVKENHVGEVAFHRVTAFDRDLGYHMFEKRIKPASQEHVLVARDYVADKMVARSGFKGNRATTVLEQPNVLAGGPDEILMTAMAVQWSSDYPSSHGVYFSDGASILKIGPLLGANDVSPSVLVPKNIIDGVCKIDIFGVNLGQTQKDVQEVRVYGAPCTNVEFKNSTHLVCFTGLRSIVKHPVATTPDDIQVITGSGGMSESNQILNSQVRKTEGYSSPIVSNVTKSVLPFSPRAITIDPSMEHIYWSDSAERSIRRSKLDGSKVELIVSGDEVAGEVCGLAFDSANRRLFFSDANSGALYSVGVNATEGRGQQGKKYKATKLLAGLHEPRGIALDVAENAVYFVEATGKIYMADMTGGNLNRQVPNKKPVFKRLLHSRPSNIRLESIALDLRGPRRKHKIFWTEMNSNLIMRATKDGLQRRAVAGMDGSVIWPRVVIHDDETGKLFYSSFLGSIKRFSSSLAQGQKEPEDMQTVHENIGPGSKHLYHEVEALGRTGGSYFLSL